MKKRLLIFFSIFIVLFFAGCKSEPPGTITGEKELPQKRVTNEAKQEPSDANDSNNGLRVHYINVGQADSTFLQFSEDGKDYTILIDAGNFNGDEVINYLHSQKVKDITNAVGTHPDADHIGQLDRVLTDFNVSEVWLSGNPSSSETFQRVLAAIDANGTGYEEPRMGDQYEIGPLTIEVLYPKELTGKTNEESISLKLTYGDVRFIFTGDAGVENELEMVQNGTNLKADILQLGHHGSSTSSSKEFLQAVNPEVAIYSAGNDNTYGHPHAEVVNLIQDSGIYLYGTDVHGTIIVTTDGKEYSIKTEREGTITLSGDENSEETTEAPEKSANNSEKSSSGTNPVAENDSCININTAALEEVEAIIHIGPERAQDLIDLRPYKSVEDLSKIKGIGPARIEDIQVEGLACVGG